MTKAQRAALEANLPFVIYKAKQCFDRLAFPPQWGDFLSLAFLCATIISRFYDPAKGTMVPYLGSCLIPHLKAELGRERRQRRELIWSIVIDGEIPIPDPRGEADLRRTEARLDVLTIARRAGMDPRDLAVLTGLLEGKTGTAIGMELMISRQRVSQIWSALLARMRAAIAPQ